MPKKIDNEIELKILQAACQHFAENRYDAVSLRNVAKTAGVTLSSISYYFESKLELYQRVARYLIQPMHKHRRKCLKAFPSVLSFEEVISAYVVSVCKIFFRIRGRQDAMFLWRFSFEREEIATLVLKEILTDETREIRRLLRLFSPNLSDSEHFWHAQMLNAIIFVSFGLFINPDSRLQHEWMKTKDGLVSRLVEAAYDIFNVDPKATIIKD